VQRSRLLAQREIAKRKSSNERLLNLSKVNRPLKPHRLLLVQHMTVSRSSYNARSLNLRWKLRLS
jgi:hypothetical protein